MGGGSNGWRHPTEEPGPWALHERFGSAVPTGGYREQGGAGGGREGVGVDGEVGTGEGRVSGEAEELVWDVLEGKWWDAAVEKLGDSRSPSYFGYWEVDIVGRGGCGFGGVGI